MYGHNGGVAELMRHRRSPSVRRYTRGILPKMVISQSQGNGWFCYPCWALVPLLDLKVIPLWSYDEDKTTCAGHGDMLGASGKHKLGAIHGEAKQRRTKRDFNKGRSFTFHTRSIGRILLKGLSHVVPEQQPNPSPMCHYHPRFT